jgi:Ca2+-dependent lipid-binding protein
LDCDVVYVGDARVIFTLQGISAQIKDIKFRGMARVHLKPLLNTFPFIGGFEMYFLSMPTLEYGLGGIGTFGDVPGINGVVRSVVEDVIRSRFVWPSRFKLYFPLDDIKHQSKASYMLPRPAGLLSLTLKEARDLLKKDKHIGGSGKSDPYAVISIGERKVSFRNRYVPKTVNPTWDYSTTFVMEDPVGQKLDIEVYDFDAGSSDDFLGKTSVAISDVIQKVNFDDWITLSEVKHGDIHVCCDWKVAKPASEDSIENTPKNFYIVSIFIDRCHDLVGGKSSATSLYPKCKLRMEGGKSEEEFSTLPRNKTENPVFEEGFLFTSKQPNKDKLIVEVIDVKGIDTVLGTITIPIDYLITSPHQEFMNKSWSLDGGHPSAKIFLSSKLFII